MRTEQQHLHAARLSPFKQTQSLDDQEMRRLYDATRTTLQQWIARLQTQAGNEFPDKVTAFHDEMAVHAARDLYTRRNEGVSIWVVKAADITASSPDEKDPMFAPSGDKVYRHPTFYDIPDNVPHM